MRPSRIKERIARIEEQIDDLENKLAYHDCDHDGHCTLETQWSEEMKNKRDAKWELESLVDDFTNSRQEDYGK